MATDLKSPNRVLPRHELFVDEQLARASRRIHALDLGRTLLWLLAATMLHTLVMAGFYLSLDSRPYGVGWAVQIGVWGVYLGVVAFLLGKLLLRSWSRVNPYFAARQIEEAIPGAKNSVVNWLDLRQRQLPAAIRDALGLRAARDLKATDPDQAVNSKHGWSLVVLAGLLLVGLLALFLEEPDRFGSLMSHAFYPLGDVVLAGRTKIVLLSPARGDVTVGPQERVLFRARIAGDVPNVNTPFSPRLLYRYYSGDSWVALPLEPETIGERVAPESWTATMPGDLVQNGFAYKIAAGDAETPQYQVAVRSLPEANRFEITHHYRPYLHWPDDKLIFPNQSKVYPAIEKIVGTEVTMQVRTNRELRQGKVELNQGKDSTDIVGEVLADDPHSFRVQFKLTKPGLGTFRVRFTSLSGEESTDNYEYLLDVRPDNAPQVTLTRPGQDVSVPANGTLLLEGQASDDYGVRSLSLHMEVSQGSTRFPPLNPQLYRPDRSLRFADGTFPERVDYKDFVALEKIKMETGEILKLAKGDVLTYWLEATDNFEYPERPGQIGKSVPYKVTIVDPQDEKKQQSERGKAQQEQNQHEKRQDEKLEQQQQARGQDKPSEQTPEQKQHDKDIADRIKKELDREDKEKKDNGQQPDQKNANPEKGSQPDVKNTKPDQGSKPDQKTTNPEKGSQPDAKNTKPDQGSKPDQKNANPEKGSQPDVKNTKPDQGSKPDQKNANPEKGSQPDVKNTKPDQGSKPDQKNANPEKGSQPDVKNTKPDQGSQPDQKTTNPEKGSQPDVKNTKPDQGSKPDQKNANPEKGSQPDVKNTKPDQGSQPDQKTTNPEKGSQPDVKNTKPDQGSKPDQKNANPEKGSQPDVKNTKPDQGSKPDQKTTSPEKGSQPDVKNTKPDQGSQPDQKNANPEKGSQPDVKNTKPDQGSQPDQKTTSPEKGSQPDVKNTKPDQGSKPDQKTTSPEKGSQPDVKNTKPDQGSKPDQKTTSPEKGSQPDVKNTKPDQGSQPDQKNANPEKGSQPDVKNTKLDQGSKPDQKNANPEKGSQPDVKNTKPDKGSQPDQKNADPEKGSQPEVKNTKPDQKNGKPGENSTRDDIDKLKESLTKKDAKSEAAARELAKAARRARDPEVRKAAEKALKDSGRSPQDFPEELPETQPDPNAARRSTDLTLEELKSKVTPDILKKAGVTEQEWQQFLKDAKAYQDSLRLRQGPSSKEDSLNQLGNPGSSPNLRPSLVDPAPNGNTSPLQNGRGQPPPGFREAYHLWTTRPQPKE